MSKTLTFAPLLATILLANIGFAQKQEGVITFESKINMHRTIKFGGDNAEQMKAMMPEYRTSKMVLYFNENESLYKAPEAKEEDDENQDINGGGNGVRMKFNTPKNEIYVNTAQSKKIELNDMFGKKFLIEDSLKTPKWKIETDIKKVAGFDCMKATLKTTGEKPQNIVAWFTSDISCASGPNYVGLPGMILEINIDEGLQAYTAQSIDFRKLKSDELKAPSGGKKVSQAEYKKIREDRLKELGMPANGGGGAIKMIIKND